MFFHGRQGWSGLIFIGLSLVGLLFSLGITAELQQNQEDAGDLRRLFNKWILPRWGSYRVTEVKAVAVEQWLRSLSYANGSKAKARNIMSAVFNRCPVGMA